MKRLLLFLVLTSGFPTLLAAKELPSRVIVGRITDVSASSLSVRDKETFTVTLDGRTVYSKLITQKPWQEDTRLTGGALRVGRFVAVHVRKDDHDVAAWIQVATDIPPVLSGVAASAPFVLEQSSASTGPTSKVKSPDLLTSKQVKALIATASTPADHVKLEKHFLALAAKYEAEATEHAAEAQAYRRNPGFMASKSPLGPGTAAHCDRFVELDREAAKEARDLASAHEQMASAKR